MFVPNLTNMNKSKFGINLNISDFKCDINIKKKEDTDVVLKEHDKIKLNKI